MRMTIENRLYMDCPEGFRRLTEEELAKMNLIAGGKGLCISDSERHIVVSVAWTQVNALSAMLLGTRETAASMQRQISKRMKQFSYEWLDNVSRKVDGQVARGFIYEYLVQGIHMFGESLVIKVEENLFYFHLYGRKVFKEETLKVFNEILDGVVVAE